MIDLTVVGNKALSKEDMFKLAIKQDDLGLLLETLKIQDVKNKEMIKAAKKAYSKALKKTNESAKAKKIKEALEWYDLARNINGKMDIGYNNAMRIVRTEGHRIQSASALDAMYAAKEKGADVVKQWDSTLDGKTRDSHRRLDGQLRELDNDFEVEGKTASAPGHFGFPKEDCNCRCALLQRARWALDEDELKILQERAEYYGLDKTSDFEDFKEKYLKAVDMSEDSGIINISNKAKYIEMFNDQDIPSNAPITAQQIIDELNTTAIGKETLEYLENMPQTIKLTYNHKLNDVRGFEQAGSITIQLGNCKNTLWAARTVVHECTHAKYGIGQSQWAECVCIAQELKHARNRNYLTIAEKRTIIKAVKADSDYSKLNWRKGGTINGRRKI